MQQQQHADWCGAVGKIELFLFFAVPQQCAAAAAACRFAANLPLSELALQVMVEWLWFSPIDDTNQVQIKPTIRMQVVPKNKEETPLKQFSSLS